MTTTTTCPCGILPSRVPVASYRHMSLWHPTATCPRGIYRHMSLWRPTATCPCGVLPPHVPVASYRHMSLWHSVAPLSISDEINIPPWSHYRLENVAWPPCVCRMWHGPHVFVECGMAPCVCRMWHGPMYL